MNNYTPSNRLCPGAEFRVCWEGDGEMPLRSHKIMLKGAEEGFDFLTITAPRNCSSISSQEGSYDSTVRSPAHAEQIGIYIHKSTRLSTCLKQAH